MTTVKQILDQFTDKHWERYPDNVEDIDIGDYTFTDFERSKDGFIRTFTNKDDPNTILRINDDRVSIVLCLIQPDDTVKVTSWRMGKKHMNTLPRERLGV